MNTVDRYELPEVIGDMICSGDDAIILRRRSGMSLVLTPRDMNSGESQYVLHLSARDDEAVGAMKHWYFYYDSPVTANKDFDAIVGTSVGEFYVSRTVSSNVIAFAEKWGYGVAGLLPD